MTNNSISVSQFNTYIKRIMDSEELLQGIKIFGEVSGFSIIRNVAYFSIKDGNATLPCVMFSVEKCQRLSDGDLVVVTGSPNYYVKAGKFSFNCTDVSPYGQGDLYKNFILLKDRLEKEGLFDMANKKTIPTGIKTIGVVTSESGAVLQDIINVATRRNPAINIVLMSAKVQGVGAEFEIAKGIRFFNTFDVDVVIVARGGGSLEDLYPFNTEVVARAVAECGRPIVSAVGHESDFTICDFVADLRAPTPSAAAELVVADVEKRKELFGALTKRLISHFEINYSNKVARLKLAEKTLISATILQVEREGAKVASLKNNLLSSMDYFTNNNLYLLNVKSKELENLDPNKILSNGYVRVEQNGFVVDRRSKIDMSGKLSLHFYDGVVIADKLKEGEK